MRASLLPKDGWCNMVTTTTLKTVRLLVLKTWRQDSRNMSRLVEFWKTLKYHSRYYCQIPLQVMVLPIPKEAEKFSITQKRRLFRYGSKNEHMRLHSEESFYVQTFIYVSVALTSFLFTALSVIICVSSTENSSNLTAICLKVKK